MTSASTPLPRFWYFPQGKKAVVVMTGDDHANNATATRFNQYLAASPAGCVVDNWECVRTTSYIYPGTQLTTTQAASFVAQGFEIALHPTMAPGQWSQCGTDFTPAPLLSTYTTQLGQLAAQFPALPTPKTSRMHCAMWSDWFSQPKTEFQKGIRLDTSYYYSGPAGWVNDRPGFFTGSAMPMRFADVDGSLIDVYQATTQMTDESGQSYPFTVNTLLDNALGPAAAYGAFTANMHTDYTSSAGSDAIVAAARARGVPIVSALQLLRWLDGRNGSTFSGLTWDGTTVGFSVSVGAGATGLQVMVPTRAGALRLATVTRNGTSLPSTVQVIKGIEYAFVAATAGQYTATYVP